MRTTRSISSRGSRSASGGSFFTACGVSRAIALAAVLFCTGCAAYGLTPVAGVFYTDVRGPLAATALPQASKEGRAACTSILGLVAQGDCSIATAMKAGGITRVQTVDYHNSGILGLYTVITVIVRGD